jgi:replicative DNA helicase
MSHRDWKGNVRPPSVLADHEPPYNLQVERALLGMILYDPSILDEVAALTLPAEFWRDTHQTIARAIWSLYDAATQCDPLTVSDELQRRGELEDVGGDAYLSELMELVPSSANGPYLARIVHQKYVARRTIEACNAVSRRGYAGDLTADQLLELAESEIFAISGERAEASLGTLGPAVAAQVARIAARPDAVAGLSTGSLALDDLLDGFHPGQLVIVGARPSMGKSALSLGFAAHAAIDLRVPVLFVSLEMNRGELAERLLSSRADVDNVRLRRPGTLSGDQMRRIGAVERQVADVPFHVDDTPSRSGLQIAAAARRLKARGGLGLVVVDYLQLVDGEDGRDSREERVAKLSRRFKVLARELNVPVLLMSQLNRMVEHRGDRRPMMSDLRESGAIEQDADVVLLLHRPEYYDPTDQPGLAEVIVAKNRNGETRTVKMAWRCTVGRFADLAHHRDDEVPDGPF